MELKDYSLWQIVEELGRRFSLAFVLVQKSQGVPVFWNVHGDHVRLLGELALARDLIQFECLARAKKHTGREVDRAFLEADTEE